MFNNPVVNAVSIFLVVLFVYRVIKMHKEWNSDSSNPPFMKMLANFFGWMSDEDTFKGYDDEMAERGLDHIIKNDPALAKEMDSVIMDHLLGKITDDQAEILMQNLMKHVEDKYKA